MPASHLLVLNAAEGRIQTVVACPVGELERYGTPAPSTDPDRDGGYVVRCAQSWHAPSQGAELLTPILRELCARLRITPADIGKIAVVRGPGSFTGLRLALATASGLARATGAVLTGIDYLPLLAASAMWRMGPAAVPGRLLWVLTHARKRLVHAQGFVVLPDTGEARISPVSALGALEVRTPEDALRDLFTALADPALPGPGLPFPPLLLGSGVSRNRDALAAFLAKESAGLPAGGSDVPAIPLLLDPDFDHPAPEALLRMAASLSFSAGDVSPYYARPADAEENLERIAASLRLDPQRARARLDELTGGLPRR